MNLFIDFSKMSETQLYDKAYEMMNYVMSVKMTGGNPLVLHQIEQTIQSIYAEIETRTSKKTLDSLNDPVVWDMESSLKNSRNRATNAESEKQKGKERRWRPTERQRSNRSN